MQNCVLYWHAFCPQIKDYCSLNIYAIYSGHFLKKWYTYSIEKKILRNPEYM